VYDYDELFYGRMFRRNFAVISLKMAIIASKHVGAMQNILVIS